MWLKQTEAKKICITSDGTPTGTKVCLEDGTVISGVFEFSVTAKAGKLLEVTVKTYLADVDVSAESFSHIVVCPSCQRQEVAVFDSSYKQAVTR